MKKYTEVLDNKRTPLTGEELKDTEEGLINHIKYTDNPVDATLASEAMELLAEVKHLREQMATAYMWIGRPAPYKGKMTRAYTKCMKEAYRIYKEMKE